MTTREKLGIAAGIVAIAIIWAAISLLAMVAATGDCFDPGCGDWKAGYLRTAPAVLALGFIAHVTVFVWFRLRKARRD